MANAMLCIEIFKFNGTWCFTDEKRELLNEPFVLGVPEIIDAVLKQQELYVKDKNYRILFADQEFPLHHGMLEKTQYDSGGFWYKWGDMKGWLCPATLAFFKEFPKEIYFRLEKV